VFTQRCLGRGVCGNVSGERSRTFSKWSNSSARAGDAALGLEQNCVPAEHWAGGAEQEIFEMEQGSGSTGAGLWGGGAGLLGIRARLPWRRSGRDESGARISSSGARCGAAGARVLRTGAKPCPGGARHFRRGASGLRQLKPPKSRPFRAESAQLLPCGLSRRLGSEGARRAAFQAGKWSCIGPIRAHPASEHSISSNRSASRALPVRWVAATSASMFR